MGHVPTSDGPGRMTAAEWEGIVSRLTPGVYATLEPRDVLRLVERNRALEAELTELRGDRRVRDAAYDAAMRAQGR